MNSTIKASDLLLEAVRRHNIHLSLLVADTALWANPAFHARLLADSRSPALFPNVRRARIGQGEKRGQVVDGVRFDDNSYANLAIKRACGLGKAAEGFEACHIWPRTCYDERYHTAVANLVLVPRALASLTDHDSEIQGALQYRASELYGWWPDDSPRPTKPDFYPATWRAPQPDVAIVGTRATSPKPGLTGSPPSQESHQLLSERIANWSRKPGSNVHRIIALVLKSSGGISRHDLVKQMSEVTQSKNPKGAVASLLTISGNAYGRVFAECDGIIRLHPQVEGQVRSLTWSAGPVPSRTSTGDKFLLGSRVERPATDS